MNSFLQNLRHIVHFKNTFLQLICVKKGVKMKKRYYKLTRITMNNSLIKKTNNRTNYNNRYFFHKFLCLSPKNEIRFSQKKEILFSTHALVRVII